MHCPVAEIFSQGDEVLSGQVVDTNAAWLSEQLDHMGFRIGRHSAVGDDLSDIVQLLNEIALRANICICTGGLGPTVDDLTAEAVAQAFSAPLKLDEHALEQIEQSFNQRNRPMAKSNYKQAYLPTGSQRVDNHWGTAPGFTIRQHGCQFFFLPGVPSEMKAMFEQKIKQQLLQAYELSSNQLVTLKTIGIGESDIQELMNTKPLPDYVRLSFRATPEEVQTKLQFSSQVDEKDIDQCLAQVMDQIGSKVFAVERSHGEKQDLLSVINQSMQQKSYRLSVLETVSQGMLAAKCVTYDWLKSASYYESPEQLANRLGILYETSIEGLAITLANQIKDLYETEIILVQLYEGKKDDLLDMERIVTLYNVLLTPDGIFHKTLTVRGSINRKQNQSAILALDTLRRYLQNLCL